MDYSKHPPTINEIKSDKTDNGSDWTPRDVLISLLRDIDSGKVKLDAVFIAGLVPGTHPNAVRPFFSAAGKNPAEILGTIDLCRDSYLRAGYRG